MLLNISACCLLLLLAWPCWFLSSLHCHCSCHCCNCFCCSSTFVATAVVVAVAVVCCYWLFTFCVLFVIEYLTVTHGSSWSLPQISGLNEDSTRTRPGLGQDWTRTGCGLDVESPAKLTIFQSTSIPLVVQSTWTCPCAISQMRSGPVHVDYQDSVLVQS